MGQSISLWIITAFVFIEWDVLLIGMLPICERKKMNFLLIPRGADKCKIIGQAVKTDVREEFKFKFKLCRII